MKIREFFRKKSKVIGIFLVFLIVFGLGISLIVKEISLNNIQENAIEELSENKGTYNEQTLVLYDTSFQEAQMLSEKLDAKLRISFDGSYATLTFSDDVSLYDVYSVRNNRKYIESFTLDYYTKTSDLESITEDETTSSFQTVKRPDYSVNDTYYAQQTYLDYLNFEDTWSTTKGNGITVAVIDTGIDTDHSEFEGKISEYSYNASEDKIVKDYVLSNAEYDWSLIEDEVGHGTGVAGVIASQMNSTGIVGIAPEVELLVIKAECSEDGNFLSTSDLVFGLFYAIERDVDVVNMSFGTTINVFGLAAALAVQSDIICVAAAGNNATTQLTYPAADSNVIGVGALAENSWELAPYSNYGENSDLVAPGTTYTTAIDGEYKTMTGTSLASPVVAGAVALYLSENKYQTYDDVVEVLCASTIDLGGLGEDWDFGYGALDIYSFILAERGEVTFNMLTDELDNTTQVFIINHTLQNLPIPERSYAIFDGWYYDIHCTEEVVWYEDIFSTDLTLYASWVNEDDGVPYTYVELDDGTIEIRSYTGSRKYITIPDMIDGKIVSSIGDFAFSGQSQLVVVNLPTYLENIGRYAFEDCSNLISITIPDSVTNIDEYAFLNNYRLYELIISQDSNLLTIGDAAFAYCSSLSSIYLPSDLNTINGSAFLGDTSLKTINVDDNNILYSSIDGVLFDTEESTIIAYPASKNDTYTIPSSVVEIGDYAFAYARFSDIDLSNTKIIGYYSFIFSALTNIDITNSVEYIGDYVFAYNFYLKEVTLGSGLTNISKYAFYYDFNLTQIYIPNNIEYISYCAFTKCIYLEEITFENDSNLEYIGSYAFYNTSLLKIEIPTSVIYIDSYAFSNSYLLEEVTFENESNLEYIGVYAFQNCINLTSILLPDSLLVIGDYAFIIDVPQEELYGLTSIVIPQNVYYIGLGAFAGCNSLETIEVNEENEWYKSIDGVVYSSDLTTITHYPIGNTQTSYKILDSVVTIAEAAFYGASNLKSIELPSNLETISNYAFYYCDNITKYDLPNTLIYIESYAFAYNLSLTTITIPNEVIQISNYAFAYNYKLYSITFEENSKLPRISYGSFAYTAITSIIIPSSVSTISQYAFAGSNSLKSVTFAENSLVESISAYMFIGCTSIETIIFESGSSLTSIQAHGFEGMTNLQYIDFSDSEISNIDNYSFMFCKSLQTITLSQSVLYIGRFAFYGCDSLQRIDVPANIEYIGSYAFYGASDLDIYFEGETLPEYLQENWDMGIRGYYIGVTDVITDGDFTYAILNSGNISIISYSGNETTIDLNSFDFGGNVTQIGGNAFQSSNITSIILPDTLEIISSYAFDMSKLESISIPANVTYIGRNAFSSSFISEVIFENESQITTIEQYSFASTPFLESITLPSSLKTLGSYAFYKSGISTLVFDEDIKLETISSYAFASTKLISVSIPSNVTLINNSAFRDCLYLENLELNSYTNLQIMSNAFYNTSITSLTIPANVEYIGEYAFVGLEELEEFIVDEQNPYYTSIDGVLYNKNVSKIISVPAAKVGVLELPQTVETIGFGAFENSSLSEVVFADNANILSIGYRAFYGANQLTSITIPASVVSIDYYAFAMCENLETVIFEEGSNLTGIYEGSFYGCGSLINIIIPDSVLEISSYAFYGCISLEDFPVSSESTLLGIYDYAFAYTGLKDVVLPTTLVDIGEYAFKGSTITSIIIDVDNPELLILELGVFSNCKYLEEISIPFIGSSYEDTQITWFGYIFGAGSYLANETYVPESLKIVNVICDITKIGYGGFYGCKNIEFINLPDTIVYLDEGAFGETYAIYELNNTISVYNSYASKITFGYGISGTLSIAEGLTYISNFAFYNCSYIENIILPESVAYIGVSAFESCISLKSINIPQGITTIEERTFQYCYSLESIIIPEGVTSIGEAAFISCSSLESIIIPESVEYISSWAFAHCSSLKNIELPNKINIIEEYTFTYCISLESVILPNSLKTIKEGSFLSCYKLSSIVIPSTLNSIEDAAFINCLCLYEIYNYAELDLEIGSTDCGNIAYNAKVIIDSNGNTTYLDENIGFCYIDTEDGFRFIYEYGEYTLISYIGEEDTITLPTDINGKTYELYQFNGAKNVIVPNSFTSINDDAFWNSTVLESVIISENVNLIGAYCFSECSNLTQVEINSDFITIEEGAFLKCTSLERIELPTSLEFISRNLFFGCASLESIELPWNIKYIGEYAFCSCTNLKSINLPTDLEEIGNHAFFNCMSLENIVIPSSVISIGEYAFSYCESLKNIEVSDNVLSIGDYAFYGCTSLESAYVGKNISDISSVFSNCLNLVSLEISHDNIYLKIVDGIVYSYDMKTLIFYINAPKVLYIPDSVETISSYAFFGCESLVKVILSNSFAEIPEYAFSGCTSLESIEISDSIVSIGSYAFQDCTSLEVIDLPESIENIGAYAFKGCSSLKNIEIPNEILSIEDGVFWDCVNLENIILPEELVYIGSLSFFNCGSLEMIVLPSGLNYIGNCAFGWCISLKHIELPISIDRIENQCFWYCTGLQTIILTESITEVGEYAFFGCSYLTSVTILSEEIIILDNAFLDCSRLNEIYNYSDLDLTIGSSDYGKIAYNAKVIIDSNGNTTYLDENSGFCYIDTEDGFRFIYEYGEYTLISYIGEEDTITLPTYINGNTYELYQFNGAKNVIVPDSFTSINRYAFEYSTILKNIILPNSIEYIESLAFSYCTSLESITLGNGIKIIEQGAFYNTKLINEADYIDGILYIDNYIIDVDDNAEYITISSDTLAIATSAFENCYSIKEVTISGDYLYILKTLTNIETLIIEEMPTNPIYMYFGGSEQAIPITLNNIILKSGCEMYNYAFLNLSNINIYVESNELDVIWDILYPNWNNGNKVYYGDEFNTVIFYDELGNILNRVLYKNSEVVIQERYSIDSTDELEYIFLGWDINGDGYVDKIPAVVSDDVGAYAVFVTANVILPTCTEGGYTIYTYLTTQESYIDDYVQALGHTLEYVERVEATCTEAGNIEYWYCSVCDTYFSDEECSISINEEDIVIKSLGHTLKHVERVEATCTEAGNIEYWYCSVCDTYFSDEECSVSISEESIVIESLGHTLEYVERVEATCTETGNIEYWYCSVCDTYFSDEECSISINEEDIVIKSLGHTLKHVERVEPTCTEAGNIEYWYCSVCDTYFSDEECSISINEEDIVIKSLGHTLEHVERVEATCTESGNIEYWYCSVCDTYFSDEECSVSISEESIVIESLGHTLEYVERVEATCTETGNIEYWYCSVCDTYFSDEECSVSISEESIVIESLGHSSDWIVGEEANYADEGYMYIMCNVCGEILETKIIDKLVDENLDLAYEAMMSANTLSDIYTSIIEFRSYLDEYSTDELGSYYDDYLSMVEYYNNTLEGVSEDLDNAVGVSNRIMSIAGLMISLSCLTMCAYIFKFKIGGIL